MLLSRKLQLQFSGVCLHQAARRDCTKNWAVVMVFVQMYFVASLGTHFPYPFTWKIGAKCQINTPPSFVKKKNTYLLQAECGGNSQSSGVTPGAADGKIRTKPLIPEMCFTTTGCSTDLNLSTPYLEEDGTSVLITCRNCQVCVHASECIPT